MGNGSIGAVIVGVDWNEHGGGVTVMGLRIGAGKDGVEAGVNATLGAEVNGNGLHAGAQAKVSMGDEGVGAAAGAQATAGYEEAGAGAKAGVNYDGTGAHAESASTCTANVQWARDALQTAQKDLDHFRTKKHEAEDNFQAKKTAAQQQKKEVQRLEHEHDKSMESKVKAGKEKTVVLDKKTDTEMRLSTSMMTLESDTRRLKASTKGGSIQAQLMKGRVSSLRELVAKLQKDVKDLDAALKKCEDDVKAAEMHLIELAEKIAKEKIVLDNMKTEEATAKLVTFQAEANLQKSEEVYNTHKVKADEAQSAFDKERHDQDFYRDI